MMNTNCRLLLTSHKLLELLSVYLEDPRRADIDYNRDCISIPFYNPNLPDIMPGDVLPVVFFDEIK